jgi:hypothetical protein
MSSYWFHGTMVTPHALPTTVTSYHVKVVFRRRNNAFSLPREKRLDQERLLAGTIRNLHFMLQPAIGKRVGARIT